MFRQPGSRTNNLGAILLRSARVTITSKDVAFTRSTIRGGLGTVRAQMRHIAITGTVLDGYVIATIATKECVDNVGLGGILAAWRDPDTALKTQDEQGRKQEKAGWLHFCVLENWLNPQQNSQQKNQISPPWRTSSKGLCVRVKIDITRQKLVDISQIVCVCVCSLE